MKLLCGADQRIRVPYARKLKLKPCRRKPNMMLKFATIVKL